MQVGVIDYGAGNIYSIICGLQHAALDTLLVRKPSELRDVCGVVIPGVGNFTPAAKSLASFKEVLQDFYNEGKWILGVCLGMQILLEESEEGEGKGLGLIEGSVKKLPSDVKVPHMGWNTVRIREESPLFEGLPDTPYFYFVHSYFADPKQQSDVLGLTSYGKEFPSIICRNSLLGLQFHPEKSAESGATILSNFKEMLVR